MGIRVLFLYPNTFGMNMFPPAIALFSALLKEHGHNVDLFDATYYQTDFGIDSDGTKAVHLNVVPFDPNEKGIKMRTTGWREDLQTQIRSFSPDLIALSTTEDMWNLGARMLDSISDYLTANKIPVVTGGVFPTFAPQIVIRHPRVDMVCVGEGEVALVELCECLEKGKDYRHITNLWVKQSDGSILKNPLSKAVDINSTPMIDISLFEEQRLYRPMAGHWYKMFPVETHRGCPYTCAYCNSPDQNTLYETQANSSFFRKKSFDLVYRELKYLKETMGAEYIYFWADTFLAWTNTEFEEFCDMYADIGLPFWMQTRPETVTDHKIKRLAEIGLHRMSAAIEHGNDEFRSKILQRRWKNTEIIEALKIPHKHGIQFSVNNITGFPTETRELAMDTVEINRLIDSDNQNMYAFVPFHGTPLRKICEEQGLIGPDMITKALTDEPALNMPQYPVDELKGLIKCFVFYVKFPKERWSEIKQAEPDTPEGERIFNQLRQEYLEKFMKKETRAGRTEVPTTADLEYGVQPPETSRPLN